MRERVGGTLQPTVEDKDRTSPSAYLPTSKLSETYQQKQFIDIALCTTPDLLP